MLFSLLVRHAISFYMANRGSKFSKSEDYFSIIIEI